MAETAFGVTYDGPALVDGRMPVRDLAPALLALGDLFADASTLLYPEREPVALNIKATNEGSFDVHLILTGWEQLVDIFSSDPASALLNLKEYVISGAGLFWLIKRLRDRRIAAQEEDPESGQIRLTLDDETTIQVPAEVLRLHNSVEVRKKARAVVEPLERQGVDTLDFHTEKEVTVRIEARDVPAYEVPELEQEPLGEHEVPMVVAIEAVAFKEKNKWRVSYGDGGTVWATMEDEAFLERVDRGIEAFRKGDMLRCQMRLTQTRDAEGLHLEHTILEVLEHIPREVQMTLGEPPPSPAQPSPATE